MPSDQRVDRRRWHHLDVDVAACAVDTDHGPLGRAIRDDLEAHGAADEIVEVRASEVGRDHRAEVDQHRVERPPPDADLQRGSIGGPGFDGKCSRRRPRRGGRGEQGLVVDASTAVDLAAVAHDEIGLGAVLHLADPAADEVGAGRLDRWTEDVDGAGSGEMAGGGQQRVDDRHVSILWGRDVNEMTSG